MNISSLRTKPEELQNMNIVFLKGVDSKSPQLCAMGWTEDGPHEDGEAIVLKEPLYCMLQQQQAPNQPPQITIGFIAPPLGVPAKSEFFEYAHVAIYEGVTTVAAKYIEFLIFARSKNLNIATCLLQDPSLKPAAKP